MNSGENLFLVPWMYDLGLGDHYEMVLGQVAAQLAVEESLELARIEIENGGAEQRRAQTGGAEQDIQETVDRTEGRPTRGSEMSKRTTQHDWIDRMTLQSGGDIGTLSSRAA